jgi:hypothetical protein
MVMEQSLEVDPFQHPEGGRLPCIAHVFEEVVRSNSAAGKASTTRSAAVRRPPPPSFGC